MEKKLAFFRAKELHSDVKLADTSLLILRFVLPFPLILGTSHKLNVEIFVIFEIIVFELKSNRSILLLLVC